MAHLESLYLLTRESMVKSGLHAFHDQAQATNRFYLGAIVLSDAVVDTIRRELRRLSDVKIEAEDLRTALKTEVLKRDMIEGEKADAARRKVMKAAGKLLRNRKDKAEDSAASPNGSSVALSVEEAV